MEKPQKKLILFMPSMDGGGVEKNLILVSNYLSKYLKNISLITYGRKFNTKFNKSINIINAGKNYKKNPNLQGRLVVCGKYQTPPPPSKLEAFVEHWIAF